ncbi:MAG: hypothetical protein RIR16_462 [Actinomycetota bacterium]|jgi:flavin reductase (DIM6/NTAB) family NADH-FMN oxidoreductase RutF
MLENLTHIDDATEALLTVFRRHASGVTVITLLDEAGHPMGFTATSVTSLGTKPPLVSFNVASGSSSYAALEQCGFVAIHTLGEANVGLAQQMAGPADLRFAGENWQRGAHGLAIFPEATSVLIGRIRQVIAVEKNAVVIVDVEKALVGEDQAGLLYRHRNYTATGENLTNS